ncbi:P-loop containing nucleoside triphosphate hydrolase protein [Collybia nuda]|uniref:P-loop containing nucleoside triphosphate hydrolase protein n=1 Tax=Collybia nuda TaxID=64659 RepID=A0A9P6CE27_9AGAR|nr:P-loop containing nucleoside triphosphate hydrolase protein [Collybia nuda]
MFSHHLRPWLARPISKCPSYRLFSVFSVAQHENPLGLPRKGAPPTMPRKGGAIDKRPIPNVGKVIAVASGKGGVGKSTIAVNLAFSLSHLKKTDGSGRLRVGILDLDIFGPSVPTLVGLQNSGEPSLTEKNALRPLINHGLPSMSMGYLLPKTPDDPDAQNDTPIVWRGLMVQKAVQQLLFDVDWRASPGGPGIDVLVIDMPPGTGDVPLTLAQLVKVDVGALIVSTPQDVALSDVRKGIAMLRKVAVPITGIVLNESHFICPSCTTPHYLFGAPDGFRATAKRLGVDILAELPLVPSVSTNGDAGIPFSLVSSEVQKKDGNGGAQWNEKMMEVAESVWKTLA